MNIEQLDVNFSKKEGGLDGMKAYSPLQSPFGLYGIFFDKERNCYARMPHSVSKTVSQAVDILSTTTAGGRIRFSTDSQKIGVAIRWEYRIKMGNMNAIAASGFALLEETEEGVRFIRCFRPSVTGDESGFFEVLDIDRDYHYEEKKIRNFILYCPLYNDAVRDIQVLLEEKAIVSEGRKYKEVLPIVYYGSSITQGGCVSRPDNAYQVFIERWTNTDFINLGFSGNAKGEKEMAEYIADLPCSVFVFDYDHNAPTVEHLQDTHYPFYKIFREKNPTTPIIFMSKPCFNRSLKGTDERFEVIKTAYSRAQKEGDENVYLIDGRSMFDEGIRANCVADSSHPNDLGHFAMANALYSIIKKLV